MSGLFRKDFALIKRQKVYFFVIVLLALAYQSPAFVASYGGIMSSSLMLSTLSYDSYEGGLGYIMTLPITRKMYVQSKYLLSMMMSATFALGAMVVGMAARMVLDGNIRAMDFGTALLSFLVVDTFLVGVSLPAVFKWGTEKGRMAAFAAMAICVAVVYGLFVAAIDISPAIRDISIGAAIAAMIPISAVLRLISYAVSVKIVEKKEL